jgi:hypothetical protein
LLADAAGMLAEGLAGSKTALVGEARWQAKPLGLREVSELPSKLSRLA